MDYKELFRHINKYKWFIIIIPIITVVITHYKVKDLPKQYVSQALLSTGFVDQSKQISGLQSLDFFKTSQQFANIIEKVKLKKVTDMLSYSLIIHDLENPRSPFEPFSKTLDSMSTEQKAEVLAEFKSKLANREAITLADPGSIKLYHIIASMWYDADDLDKSLVVSHADGSDFIAVTYTSNDPSLSSFVVNTLCTQFIDYNNRDIDFNQGSSITLLDSLLKKKETVMNQKIDSLKAFKTRSGVLNLENQSVSAYTELTAARAKRDETLREIQADQGAVAGIEAKLRGKDPYISNTNIAADNKEIVDLRSQLNTANNKNIDDGFKPSGKKRVDSLTALLNAKLGRNNDNNIVDPTASRQNLLQQRSTLQVSLDQARNSIASLNNQIAQLQGTYNKMVPFDANIQNYQREAEQATKDYTDAFNRYNLTKTEQSVGTRVNLAQAGIVGAPEPSKKMIFLVIAFAGSFALCFVIVVALFFLDHSINSAKQLVLATDMPIIGALNYINASGNPIKTIWNDASNNDYVTFKNLLRSIRFEITSQMRENDSKILGITSLEPGEGRSFIASSLAYAFAMTGKKVLLIGAENQSIENSNARPELRDKFETFLIKRELHAEHLITVLNKNDSNTSLLEIQSSNSIKTGFDILRKDFDIIIIDVNSLRDLNVAKEWLLFTDKHLAIFKVGKEMSDYDKELLVHLRDQPGFMGWVMNKVKLRNVIA